MKYLVTGGAGFIGSHMSEYLLNQSRDNYVVIFDNFSTGTMDNLDFAQKNKRCKIIQGSILNKELLDELIRDSDYVFHFASSVGVKYVISNLLKSLDTIVIGSRNVFELATKYKKRVLFSSSSEVYGKSNEAVYSEESDKIIGSTSITRWNYSNGKSLAEYYAQAFICMGLRIDILRFFNIVGPRQSSQYGMVIPNFIQKALSGEDIPVYGDGTQRRCFTYVGDAVDICYRISQLPESTNQIINLGNDKSISIVDLAEIVLKKTGSNVKKVYIPYEQVYGKDFEDCQNRVPSTKKLFSIIGSYKFTEIEKIIELIIKHDYADLMNDHKYCALQEDVYNVRFK